jgi:hypothetical protein
MDIDIISAFGLVGRAVATGSMKAPRVLILVYDGLSEQVGFAT